MNIIVYANFISIKTKTEQTKKKCLEVKFT